MNTENNSEPYEFIHKDNISSSVESVLEQEILNELEQSLLQIQPSQREDIVSKDQDENSMTAITTNNESMHSSPVSNIIQQEASLHANRLFSEEGSKNQEGDQHPAIHDFPKRGDASNSDCTSSLHTDHSLSFAPPRSETPMTNHEDLLINEEEKPPSSRKFSPKKILNRARSSITEETARSLGRRTSLFLDKMTSPPATSDTTIRALRRQSSKLTNKGKSFTKKLKHVVSFHQKDKKQLKPIS